MGYKIKLCNICFLYIGLSFFELSACVEEFETPVINYLRKIELAEVRSNFEPLDCIYIINLDERVEKWERMKELFAQKDILINRVSAINGWNISKEIQKELVGPYPFRLRGGQIGCLLSHVSVIKDAYDRKFNLIWILEDDVGFIEDPSQISKLLGDLSEIDPNWDVFYTDIDSKNLEGEYIPSLSSDFRPNQDHLPISFFTERVLITKDLMKIGQRFGMYSLIISQKGIKKILDYFTHVYLWTSVDIDIHYVPGLRQYSSTKDIVSVCDLLISDTEKNPNF